MLWIFHLDGPFKIHRCHHIAVFVHACALQPQCHAFACLDGFVYGGSNQAALVAHEGDGATGFFAEIGILIEHQHGNGFGCGVHGTYHHRACGQFGRHRQSGKVNRAKWVLVGVLVGHAHGATGGIDVGNDHAEIVGSGQLLLDHVIEMFNAESLHLGNAPVDKGINGLAAPSI